MKLPRLILSPRRGKIAANTLSQLLAKLFTAGTTFLITLLLARTFGAAGYGDFVKITSYVAFFYLFADFGMNAVFLQHAVGGSAGSSVSREHTYWNALLFLRFLASVGLSAVALATLALLPRGTFSGYTPLVRLGIIFFVPSIAFQGMLTSANALFQKHLRYDLSTVAVGFGSVVSLLLVFAATLRPHAGNGVLYAVGALLVGSAVSGLSAYVLSRGLLSTFRLSWPAKTMREIVWQSIPLGITLVFNLIYFRIDSFILALTRPTAEVGIYGLAYKFFEVPLVVPTFFMNAVYPMLLATQRHNKEHMVLLKKSFLFLAGLSFVTAALISVAAPVIAFIRQDFVPSVSVLRILAVGIPFFFLSSVSMWGLVAQKKLRQLAFIYGGGMLVNLGLNIVYIPTYGYTAAAWVTVVSEALVLLATGAVLAKSFIKTHKG